MIYTELPNVAKNLITQTNNPELWKQAEKAAFDFVVNGSSLMTLPYLKSTEKATLFAPTTVSDQTIMQNMKYLAINRGVKRFAVVILPPEFYAKFWSNIDAK